MKLALCLVTLLTFLITIKADLAVPSYLKLVGSYKYNTTDDGKITLKRYYSSNRIAYRWVEASMVCKSVGMRMAFIETDDELKNLASMGRKNSKIFEKRVFVDGYNLTVVSEYDYDSDRDEKPAPTCYSVQKYRRGKLLVFSEKCNEGANKFLCERMEIVDSYDEHQLNDDKVDVKATFFTYIGNFGTKKYYASFKLESHANNVPKICQSFGMQMVSPRNQAEYDNLSRFLQNFHEDWYSISIAGYRSDENQDEWIASNEKLNYVLDWNKGEPNNHDEDENCLALKDMGVPKLNDIPCSTDFEFICEFDESIADVQIPVQIDPMFLKPLTNYKIGSTTKELFVGVFDVDWTTANLICHNFGMELFAPSSAADDESLRKELVKITGVPDGLHVGITSMGTKDVWYSVNTGKIVNFDLDWAPHYNDYIPSDVTCMKLQKSYQSYSYSAITCTKAQNNFICQKLTEVTEEEQNITSTTTAS